jgi:REP element-mobilizing transposase RayT
MRKLKFVNGEYYHIYNRGVDKRIVFESPEELERFFLSMQEFNTSDCIGSIYANSYPQLLRSSAPKSSKLIIFVCYDLLPNHYHFLVRQITEDGVRKFMHKIGTGYTNYFNEKHKRSGSLFQGKYKAIHVDSNEYLLHLSTYINLNHQVHNLEKFGGQASKLFKSSWDEYLGRSQEEICVKDIVLDQFGSRSNYQKFSEEGLERIKESKEIQKYLLEESNN